MVKIGLISHSPNIAGAEKMLFNLALMLKSSNLYEPVVFIPDSDAVNDGLKHLCTINNILTKHIVGFPYYFFDSSADINYSLEKLKDSIRSSGVKLIVCNTASSLVPTLAAYELNIPSILWVHGIVDGITFSNYSYAQKRLITDRFVFKLSNRVIYCSEWTKNFYKEFVDNGEVINNWVSEQKGINAAENQKVRFLCLNTFNKIKGIEDLLEAAKIVHEKRKDFTIDFYSEKSVEIEEHFINFVKENGLENIVNRNEKIWDTSVAYNRCDCLIQPSLMESFGLTIVEAMSFGRPVISTKSGGPDNIVQDGITGFLVDKKSPEQIAEKMIYFLDNRQDLKTMGESGRKLYQEKFTEEVAAKKFISCFDSVLNDEFKRHKDAEFIYALLYEFTNHFKFGISYTNEATVGKSQKLFMLKAIFNKIRIYLGFVTVKKLLSIKYWKKWLTIFFLCLKKLSFSKLKSKEFRSRQSQKLKVWLFK